MKKGHFISFEGPDGSGKTTISSLVSQALKKRGFDVVYTREPGGIRISEMIRDLILDPKNVEMDAKTEALLYAAGRRQHLVEKIIPNIDAGRIVLSDRFVDSSLAYQGVGREIGIKEVFDINMFAIEGYMPELTIYLDIDPQVGLDRIGSRDFKDRLDQEDISFHERVSQGYELVKEKYQERLKIFDGNRSIEDLTSEITEYIIEWITAHEA
ncbi:MAG TPA: dTMP kinase [Erysipelothrix sp.]|jgi:dTMP kinase|nr:dTMP kinase [Erysipelothrix sp.]